MRGLILIVVLFHAFPAPAAAQFEDAARLDRAAANFLKQEEANLAAHPADRRLRLPRCTRPLTAAFAGRRALTVGCSAPKWHIYLPLNGTAPDPQPEQAPLVVALRASLPRGSLLTRADLMLTTASAQPGSDTVRSIDMAEGRRLQRSLTGGTVLRLAALESAPAVRRGDHVVLKAAGAGFAVSGKGKARQEGAAGATVSATNLKTGRRVEGVVTADGSLLIPF